MRIESIAIALLLSIILSPRPALATCPDSGIECGEEEAEFLADPAFERTCFLGTARVSLAQSASEGILRCEKSGEGVNGGAVRWVDEFVVRNLAPGTAVQCRAQLIVEGSTFMPVDPDPENSHSSRISSYLLVAGGASADFTHEAPDNSGLIVLPSHVAAEIPVSFEVDVPTRIRVDVECLGVGGGKGRLSARIHFIDLPDGALVESCKGYRQSTAVPARPLTWGALKSAYR